MVRPRHPRLTFARRRALPRPTSRRTVKTEETTFVIHDNDMVRAITKCRYVQLQTVSLDFYDVVELIPILSLNFSIT
jgi:hypothetical protein